MGDVQNGTPQSGSIGPIRPASGLQLGVVLASVASGARRRAVRDGDSQVDTAHLLHTLLESDPDVRAALDGGPPQVARLLGYLVQRSIGYGLRWRGSIEDSGAVPVGKEPRSPGWSPAAMTAMEGARARARARGGEVAEGLDLLGALAADRDCRAVEVLHRAGVDPERLSARLAGFPASGVIQGDAPVDS
ncbi:Clp protease N-terminal domain-containing protein [Streptomyces sp. 8N706]|uniref:Clp protease N-terminal domain-containing protein n=1 Tax=Streptomyces sp. 8N706 TaxID=3457416 RepID=UPI003FD6BCC8